MPDFLHVDTYSWKLKADLKIWGRGGGGWMWSKMGVATLFMGL